MCVVMGCVANRCVYLQIHYDGWSQQFDLWCDSDISDLHPSGWCQRTGHPLEPPPGPTDSVEGGRERCRCTRTWAGGANARLFLYLNRFLPCVLPLPGGVSHPRLQGRGPYKGRQVHRTPQVRAVPPLSSGRDPVLTSPHLTSPVCRPPPSAFGCPYSDINMRKEVVLPDRLGGERVITLVPVTVCSHGNQPDR